MITNKLSPKKFAKDGIQHHQDDCTVLIYLSPSLSNDNLTKLYYLHGQCATLEAIENPKMSKKFP
jgi:hypothetical protein